MPSSGWKWAPSCRSAQERGIGSFCQEQTFAGADASDRVWSRADARVWREGRRSADVADALSELTGRPIQAAAVQSAQLEGTFPRVPSELADIATKTNDTKNDGGLVDVDPEAGDVRNGRTELIDALKTLLPRL